jgi:hypothetical protein
MMFTKHKTSYASRSYFEFKSSHGQSKPLNMIFILKYFGRSNFIFFLNLFWMVHKSLDQ